MLIPCLIVSFIEIKATNFNLYLLFTYRKTEETPVKLWIKTIAMNLLSRLKRLGGGTSKVSNIN